jgi:hypothetical protein
MVQLWLVVPEEVGIEGLPSGGCSRFVRVFDMPNVSLQRLRSVKAECSDTPCYIRGNS